MRNSIIAACLLLIGAGLPSCATAQANPDSIHRRNDCRLAAQVLTTGNPRPRLEWAAQVIQQCPAVGATVAEGLSRHRTSRDTTFLNWITFGANSVQDRAMLETGLAVLQDASASAEARVYAARLLYWLLYPSAGVYYGTMVDADGDGRWPCIAFGSSSHLELVRGAALPADWRQQVHTAADAIARDSTVPAPAREAAVCVAVRSRPAS